jgi:hypothetical protein
MNKLFKKLHGCKFCKGCKMVANDIQTPFVAVFEFPPLQVDYYHVAVEGEKTFLPPRMLPNI